MIRGGATDKEQLYCPTGTPTQDIMIKECDRARASMCGPMGIHMRADILYIYAFFKKLFSYNFTIIFNYF